MATAVPSTTQRVARCGVVTPLWEPDAPRQNKADAFCYAEWDQASFARRRQRFLLTYRGELLQRMVHADAQGGAVADSEGCAIWSFERAEEATAVQCLDAAEHLVRTYEISADRTRILIRDVPGRTDVRRSGRYDTLERSFDAMGRVLSLRFLNSNGSAGSDVSGIHEYRYPTEGARGSLTRFYYDALGQPMKDDKGAFGVRFGVDAHGDWVSRVSLDLDGQPTNGTRSWARLEWDRDRSGNIVALHFLDVAGVPIADRSGYASLRNDYDELGCRVRQTTLGPDGRPVDSDRRYATTTSECDERGNTQVDPALQTKIVPS